MPTRSMRGPVPGRLLSALLLLAAQAPLVIAQSPASAPPAASAGATTLATAAAPTAAAAPNQVVVTGTVPDEATRAAILARVRELYGAERVRDQLGVGAVVAPPNWSAYVQKLISPNLKQISRGQLSVQGNNVDVKGEVGSEGARQQLAAEMVASLNTTYAVRNALRVGAQEQAALDQTLANRIVEFEPGSSVLKPEGLAIVNDMAAVLLKMPGKKVEVIGHTDAMGGRDANIALSIARADTVRVQLARTGVPIGLVSTSGAGPDRPVASNATQDGRARNRRIEFRVSQ